MPTMQERHEMVETIRQLPIRLKDAVNGLDDTQLNTPYGEGKWTIRQVVHHLADAHLNAYVRYKLVLTENNPTLKPYDQDEWARLRDGSFAPVQASLSILNGIHERWCDLMDTLSENSWRRTAMHPETGEVTLDSLLVTYAKHGENHVKQITDLRESRGW